MNLDQIRIAVAECLGWKRIEPKEIDFISYPAFACSGTAEFVSPDGTESLEDWIPNYPASLDACAEFEKTLTEEELDRYVRELVFLMKTGEPRVFMSPPLRRCIAYLRVKGKWTEKGAGTV